MNNSQPHPTLTDLLIAAMPSRQLLEVARMDAELAELQELDRRAWLRERVAAPGASISWPAPRSSSRG